MVSCPEGGEAPLLLRHGIRCAVESSVAVEEVSIGEKVGYVKNEQRCGGFLKGGEFS